MPEYRADAGYKYRNSGSVSESATAMRTYLHCGDTAKPSALVYSGQSSEQNILIKVAGLPSKTLSTVLASIVCPVAVTADCLPAFVANGTCVSVHQAAAWNG